MSQILVALLAATGVAVVLSGCGGSNSISARFGRCVDKVAQTSTPDREAFARGVCTALERDGQLAGPNPISSDTLNPLLRKQPALLDPVCVPEFMKSMPYAPAAARVYVDNLSPHAVAERICRTAALDDPIGTDFGLYLPSIANALHAHPALSRPWVFYRLVWQYDPAGTYTRAQWFKGSWHAAVRVVAARLVGSADNDRNDYYTTKPKLVERLFMLELAKTRTTS